MSARAERRPIPGPTLTVETFMADQLERAPKLWAAVSDRGRRIFPGQIYLLLPSGELELYVLFHGSREQEINVVAQVRGQARQKGAIAASLLAEVWGHPRLSTPGDQVRDREDRTESLQLIIQTHDRLWDEAYVWPLERDERGARLGKRKKAARCHHGLYRNIIERRGPLQ